MTVKAHPNVKVVAVQRLELAPKVANTSAVLDAVTTMFQSFPDINDMGFAGYGYWAINSYQILFGNTTAGYYHDFWNIGNDTATSRTAFAPVRARLDKLQDLITISETYKEYPDYWTMYEAESSLNDPVGTTAALSSRLFDRASVSDSNQLRNTLATTIGPPAANGVNGAVPATAATGARRAPKRSERAAGGGGASGDTLLSPLQGNMWKVLVEQGQTVEEGQIVCIIEAMKMENEITAHKAGTIEDLPISEGAAVKSGDLLAVIK